MRNKIRLIDVSILSSYMGKSLTVVVTLFVVGIAVAALIDGGGVERNIIRICVPARGRPGQAVQEFEPLRSLLARETHRPVILVESDGEWPAGCDVYVMPVDAFFRRERSLGVHALFEIRPSEREDERAVVIASRSAAVTDASPVPADAVVYADPASVNGFWVQANGLLPADAELDVRAGSAFEGTRDDATRVVVGVALGAFEFGACRLGEVSALAGRGLIHSDEIRVVWSAEALPETVIAVRAGEERYFEGRLSSIARLLEDKSALTDSRDSVELLKTAGVRRVDRLRGDRLDRVRGLYERFEPASSTRADAGPPGS